MPCSVCSRFYIGQTIRRINTGYIKVTWQFADPAQHSTNTTKTEDTFKNHIVCINRIYQLNIQSVSEITTEATPPILINYSCTRPVPQFNLERSQIETLTRTNDEIWRVGSYTPRRQVTQRSRR